jgi:hypothetical protein
LVKKLHRHTNAHRQLVFDILSSKTGICSSILITRSRLLLLNDYEPSLTSISLNELKEKLKIEINRSLEFHIQGHNQAIKLLTCFFRLFSNKFIFINLENGNKKWLKIHRKIKIEDQEKIFVYIKQ